MCECIRSNVAINIVALSGGVFQNTMHLEHTIKLLRNEDFDVYWNTLVPPSDGGISLGQAFIGINTFNKRGAFIDK